MTSQYLPSMEYFGIWTSSAVHFEHFGRRNKDVIYCDGLETRLIVLNISKLLFEVFQALNMSREVLWSRFFLININLLIAELFAQSLKSFWEIYCWKIFAFEVNQSFRAFVSICVMMWEISGIAMDWIHSMRNIDVN